MKSYKTFEQRGRNVRIASGASMLEGELSVPANATGIVLFAHGSGSSRHSPRNQYVARAIREAGVGTLLFDLLTQEEEAVDLMTRRLRFDIDLLAERLLNATLWVTKQDDTSHLRVGYFGASTGGGAALVAAARRPQLVGAVVSRGGRPDLAGAALARVQAPTLLIVGENDPAVIAMNEAAMAELQTIKRLEIIPGATHLFEEPGAMEKVTGIALDWFNRYLNRADAQAAPGR